jgi:hypothetical protein
MLDHKIKGDFMLIINNYNFKPKHYISNVVFELIQ